MQNGFLLLDTEAALARSLSQTRCRSVCSNLQRQLYNGDTRIFPGVDICPWQLISWRSNTAANCQVELLATPPRHCRHSCYIYNVSVAALWNEN